MIRSGIPVKIAYNESFWRFSVDTSCTMKELLEIVQLVVFQNLQNVVPYGLQYLCSDGETWVSLSDANLQSILESKPALLRLRYVEPAARWPLLSSMELSASTYSLRGPRKKKQEPDNSGLAADLRNCAKYYHQLNEAFYQRQEEHLLDCARNLVSISNKLMLSPDQTVSLAALRGYCIPYVSFIKMLYNNGNDQFLQQSMSELGEKIEDLFNELREEEKLENITYWADTGTGPQTVQCLSKSKIVEKQNQAYSEIQALLNEAASSVNLKELSSSTRSTCCNSADEVKITQEYFDHLEKERKVSQRLREEFSSLSDSTKQDSLTLSQQVIQEMLEI